MPVKSLQQNQFAVRQGTMKIDVSKTSMAFTKVDGESDSVELTLKFRVKTDQFHPGGSVVADPITIGDCGVFTLDTSMFDKDNENQAGLSVNSTTGERISINVGNLVVLFTNALKGVHGDERADLKGAGGK